MARKDVVHFPTIPSDSLAIELDCPGPLQGTNNNPQVTKKALAVITPSHGSQSTMGPANQDGLSFPSRGSDVTP